MVDVLNARLVCSARGEHIARLRDGETAESRFGGPGRDRTDDLFHAMEARSQLRHRPTLSRRDSLILKLSAAIVNVWSAWVAPRSGPCTRPVSYSWPRSIPTCSGAESPLPATRRVIWSY